jgi:hypothetical protein
MHIDYDMFFHTYPYTYGRRDGRDCNFNVIVNVAEARGLAGKGGTGLNDCCAKVLQIFKSHCPSILL